MRKLLQHSLLKKAEHLPFGALALPHSGPGDSRIFFAAPVSLNLEPNKYRNSPSTATAGAAPPSGLVPPGICGVVQASVDYNLKVQGSFFDCLLKIILGNFLPDHPPVHASV